MIEIELSTDQEFALRLKFLDRERDGSMDVHAYEKFTMENIPGISGVIMHNPDYVRSLIFDSEQDAILFTLRFQ